MNTTSFITNDYFKDHDTFKKYPELFITDEYISYIDSLPFIQRLQLRKEYHRNLMTKEDLLYVGKISFSRHPELLLQEASLLYGSDIIFPKEFVKIEELPNKRKEHWSNEKRVRVLFFRKNSNFKKNSSIREIGVYRFLKGGAYSPKEKFGKDLRDNLQKTVDSIFKEGEVTVLNYDREKDVAEFQCNLINCPLRTSTCFKWVKSISQFIDKLEKSSECVSLNIKNTQSIPKEVVDKRVSDLYDGTIILLDDYTNVHAKASFQCNRTYCENFNSCLNKKWTTQVSDVLNGKTLRPVMCNLMWNSLGELLLQQILEKNHIKYIYQKSFIGMRYKLPLRVDFYLPEYNVAIEVQGNQHRNKKEMEGLLRINKGISSEEKLIEEDIQKAFDEQQKRDILKKEYLQENDIILIEIPYSREAQRIENALKEYIEF